jgi:hypothetical protein
MKKILNLKFGLVKAVALMGLAWACSDDFLVREPLGVLDEAAMANKFGTESQLIATYSMLDGYNIDNANVWAANPVNWVFGSITSGDAYKGSEATDDPGGFAQTEQYNWTPSMIVLDSKYVPHYEGIARANATLRNLAQAPDFDPNIPADAARKVSIEGEAKFLRAYFHFELYKVFTHIPYYREDDTDLKKPNAGVDVLAECEADLLEAVALLPNVQAQKGRANKFAARALLGKVYMFQAQPSNTGTTLDPAKLALAKAQFDLIVANPDYSLVNCYHDLFAVATENNTETIFAIQSSGNDNNQARNANWLNQLAYPNGGGAATGCCGFHQPSQNLVNAYRVTAGGLPALDNSSNANPGAADLVDPRMDFNVGRNGVPFYDWGIHATTWVRSPAYGGQYNNKKYMPYKTDAVPAGGWNGPANNTINIQLIRLADVMLMLAECEVEIGSLTTAENLVNAIRNRADNCAQGPVAAGGASVLSNIDDASITWANYEVEPYPGGTFSTQAIARDAVRLERRLELALEGHRFFDLKRWGYQYAKAYIDAYIATEKDRRGYLTGAAPFSEKHMSFPLPTQQIQLSLQGSTPSLTQNDGY